MSRGFRCAALLSLALLTACGQEEQAVPDPVRPVLFTTAEKKWPEEAQFTGTVEPRYTTDLGFQVLGRMISRSVNVGDEVEEGQQIALLDPASLEFAVRVAEASLSAAKAQLANAEGSEKRLQALAKNGVSSKASLDTAEQSRKTAEANVDSAEADLHKAREQLGFTRLTATFDGIVTATDASVGQVVSAGQTVVSIARLDARDAVVDVPEALVTQLRGKSFEAFLQTVKGPGVKAEIREVAPQATSATRTQRVRMTLENPPENFRLGALVTLRSNDASDEVITLPMTSLLEEDGKTYVWRIDEASMTVEKVAVTVGRKSAGEFVAVNGVMPGQKIVTAGVHSLESGQKVYLGGEPEL
ncbi:efflux RND transporter periplasmic adaptor subunit [Roseibium litorale]|uniref:Efflux RND transporter periplasmic adaptor subunit n=1 Tax=Roseibium litorale TaxID=2803841 RepID=A0ABR9CTE4_9HYPH|nr:efflux RND transporter periplasmic adaptor subunit [Roseibium litorale]MBD8893894.1 efflux RND transporter periplasmic adaptor subunit [Roseibium litorale]